MQRQLQDARALAERTGWTVAEWYTDNDLSAFGGKGRPGYGQLMRDAEKGRSP